ncbi:MAG: TPM domain-containing protein [Methylophilus sp.]|nr:TPM domain-containing protein [Methylophilus sp.]
MSKRNPIVRFFTHLLSTPFHVRARFSQQALSRIEQAIEASEQKHAGEIRFVVEAGLHPVEIIYKKTPRKRALELFGRLNIWDTEHNNGVLIYLLLADRDVEIVADRGIDRLVGHEKWNAICHDMELMFKRGEFEAGILQGISEISALMSQHFPSSGLGKNEISNRPVVM